MPDDRQIAAHHDLAAAWNIEVTHASDVSGEGGWFGMVHGSYLRVGVDDPPNCLRQVRLVFLLFLTFTRSRVHENRVTKGRRSDGKSV